MFEPQKQRNKTKKCRKRKSDILSLILSLDPLYFQQLYLVHFSFILNDYTGYKCGISKSIKLIYNEFFFIKQLKSSSFKIILNIYEKVQTTTPFSLKGHILLIFHQIITFFTNLDTPSGALQNCLSFKRNKPWTRQL